MGINKRHLWKIDEVLDPTSNFWENIEEDMESYIDSLSEEQVKSISAEKFKVDFTEYFNNIANRTLYKEIKDAEDIVTKVLWSQLTSEDKEDVFHNDVGFFSDWIDSCPKDLLGTYVKMLGEGKSLKDAIETSLNYSDFFDAANLSPESVNVSLKNNRLSICSTSKEPLDKLKKVLEASNHKLISESEEPIEPNLTLYTYHFLIKE
tara:strand:- start:226 stop:843 length:618 start_codon:yes stop_codon:yes gene_type:complete